MAGNKLLVALTALIAVSSFYLLPVTQSAVPLKVNLAHQKWMLDQKKVYGSPKELEFRLQVFHKAYNMVTEHNSNPKKSYTMGLNQFADMTDDEIKAKYLDSNPTEEDMEGDINPFIPSLKELEDLPDSVDWRKKNIIPENILNYENCEASWAFSAASAAEAEYNRVKSLKTPAQFSPQQLLNCVS
jgi:hypothetical protein